MEQIRIIPGWRNPISLSGIIDLKDCEYEVLPAEPRLQMKMTNEEIVSVPHQVVKAAAVKVLESLHGGNYYSGQFDIECGDTVYLFDVSCDIYRSPFKGDDGEITDIEIRILDCEADQDGRCLPTDLTDDEFRDYLMYF